MNRTADFFAEPLPPREEIVPQVLLLRGFADGAQLWPEINRIACASPFRHMQTPGGGRMSVAITNCGELGWVSDRRGYRYSDIDPETGHRWPAMPEVFDELARRAAHEAGYASFASDACLVNRYAIGASMGSHQDRNERDFSQPIVSVSLGLDAVFLWYGAKRSGTPKRVPLRDGDVLVWGGAARLGYHGVAKLRGGVGGDTRVNLTLRCAG
jgi:DNA oxidative demethylase